MKISPDKDILLCSGISISPTWTISLVSPAFIFWSLLLSAYNDNCVPSKLISSCNHSTSYFDLLVASNIILLAVISLHFNDIIPSSKTTLSTKNIVSSESIVSCSILLSWEDTLFLEWTLLSFCCFPEHPVNSILPTSIQLINNTVIFFIPAFSNLHYSFVFCPAKVTIFFVFEIVKKLSLYVSEPYMP